jgi:hypothetical protein
MSTTAPGALVSATKMIVDRASLESDGFPVLVDHAPTVGPISPPAGRTVLAPSARRAAGVVRRQLRGAAKTNLKKTTNPSAERSSKPAPATIHFAHPSITRAGTAATVGTTRNVAATAPTTSGTPSCHR